MVAPHADMAAERRARDAAGDRFVIEQRDLYADAAACIAACKEAGLVVGIAGNQPAEAEAALLACGLDAHHLATSAGWGVSKPDPKFFDLVCEACGLPAEQIAYVGDRVRGWPRSCWPAARGASSSRAGPVPPKPRPSCAR
jgi:HAD superfamily hydrolase (TIGR01549 family)